MAPARSAATTRASSVCAVSTTTWVWGERARTLAGGLDAVHAARHPQVHHHHVRQPLLELRERLLAARRGADHREVRERFEIAAQAGLDHAVVVYEDEAGRFVRGS